MAWKELSSNTIDIRKQKDVAFIGIYQGSKKIQTKIGEQTIYNFMDEEGEPFGIYGFTNLNRIMEGAKEDLLYRITYTGTENRETKFGRKDVHQVKVEIDEEPGSETT